MKKDKKRACLFTNSKHQKSRQAKSGSNSGFKPSERPANQASRFKRAFNLLPNGHKSSQKRLLIAAFQKTLKEDEEKRAVRAYKRQASADARFKIRIEKRQSCFCIFCKERKQLWLLQGLSEIVTNFPVVWRMDRDSGLPFSCA